MSRDKADTLLLLTACTLVLMPHALHLPAWESALCAVLLLWRGWITLRGNRLPPRWLLLPIAMLVMLAVLREYGTWLGREAGVAMLTLLLALKLLEMRARRDLFVVLLLSFFVLLTRFFWSQSIGAALFTFVTLVAIFTAQLSFQYADTSPPLSQRLRSAFKICVLGIPLALLLFFLFPRIQGPLWGLPGDANVKPTGLSDTMSPGNISQLAESNDIAFRVKFAGDPPPKRKLYWRAIVLGHFDGKTWTGTPGSPFLSPPLEIRTHGNPVRYQVTLEATGQRRLYALDLPTELPKLQNNPIAATPQLELLATRPINERVRYEAVSIVDFDMQPNLASAVLRGSLQLPEGYNPRALQFAADLRRRSRDDIDFINAVLQYFHRESFVYTLEPPLLGRDSVDDFLFSTRAGFCEHYSGAFTVLMRAAGIPARVVMGYQGGEMNPVDGFMVVRQSDAHAWSEVWLPQRGWVRIDPTAAVAPERVEHNLRSAIPPRYFGGLVDGRNIVGAEWLAAIRSRWEAINNQWNQWVLNYTPDRQKDLMRKLGFDDASSRDMIILLVALCLVTMGVLGYWLTKSREKIDPVRAAYEALCRDMARRGLPREPHEGPQTYCLRLTSPSSQLTSTQKRAISRFLQLYAAVQYGRAEVVRADAAASLRSLLPECR
jgi:transglutaminase-like putative cysteine protease